eukprot:TRINITY_DN10604_c0_g2_i2.p1 TRINITY_DN10604_c0_g2~~TRINITY_DN10604_c0_g2_i2.p1  ORF type:complete len:230 (+),score=29.35 TRINITY_DN10604_c0_g2_i2:361-1050(+)
MGTSCQTQITNQTLSHVCVAHADCQTSAAQRSGRLEPPRMNVVVVMSALGYLLSVPRACDISRCMSVSLSHTFYEDNKCSIQDLSRMPLPQKGMPKLPCKLSTQPLLQFRTRLSLLNSSTCNGAGALAALNFHRCNGMFKPIKMHRRHPLRSAQVKDQTPQENDKSNVFRLSWMALQHICAGVIMHCRPSTSMTCGKTEMHVFSVWGECRHLHLMKLSPDLASSYFVAA